MTRRFVDLIRGLGSLIAVIAIMAGVPAMLWQLDGPPGARIIYTLSDELASETARTEALLSGTLLAIGWVCWVQLAYAIAVEAVAAMRGRTPHRAPILPGLQALAARLITSVTLITGSLAPSVHAAAAAPLQPIIDTPVEIASAGSVYLVEQLPPPIHRVPVPDVGESYIAGSRDTFWSIAEATLGDGLRWHEIRDVNLGRTMPDGSTIAPSTETVQAGWNLLLPGGAVLPLNGGSAAAEPSDQALERLVEVADGDHFWGIAENAMRETWGRTPTDTELVPYWAEVVRVNGDRLLPPGNPDVIYPGQRLELPPVPADPQAPPPVVEAPPEPVVEEPEAPSDTADAPPVQSEQPAETTPAPSTTALAPPLEQRTEGAAGQGSQENESPAMPIVVGVGSLATGAAALALTLRRRRVYQATKRAPGTLIEEPSAEAAEYEARVRSIADTEALRWIDAANKLLSHRLGQLPDASLPAVVAMRAGRFGVEMLLDEPCTPPAGFVPTPEGPTTWRLDPQLELATIESEANGAQPYAPALIAAGTTPAGEILLDLEQIGVLSVSGDASAVDGWLRAVATAAAITPWATYCEVVAIGLPEDVASLPNVTAPHDPVAWCERHVLEMQKLSERLTNSPYHHRIQPGEVFHPTIVLIGPGHDELGDC